MGTLLDKLRQDLTTEDQWSKTSFWSSDCERPAFDLYHRFKGTPETNPVEAEKQIVFGAGKAFELALVDRLRKMGLLVVAEGSEDEGQVRIDIEREGVVITGKMDAIVMEDGELVVVEIKTTYSPVQDNDLDNGKPKTGYLKQLATYMDAMDTKKGILLYMNRGTGKMWQFDLFRREGLVFECKATTEKGFEVVTKFDLSESYKRFRKIWDENISKDVEPEPLPEYKTPLSMIDWSIVPKNKITEARMGRAVIGAWEPKYSPFKNLWVAKEAAKHGKTFEEYLGYSDIEIEEIKKATAGFTSKSKKEDKQSVVGTLKKVHDRLTPMFSRNLIE